MQVKLTDAVKFLVDHAWAVWVVLTIVLFVTPASLGALGLGPFRPSLAIVFLAVSAVVLVQIARLVRDWLAPKLATRKTLARLHERLHCLTVAEQAVLAKYVKRQTRTQSLDWTNGIIVGLENAQIIYRSSPVYQVGVPCSFNMQDWAYTYLTEHPDLVGLGMRQIGDASASA